MFDDVAFVSQALVDQILLGLDAKGSEILHAVDHIHGEMVAIKIVEHEHVERCRGGTFFFVAPNVHVGVVCTSIGELMNERRIAVKREDHGFVCCEDLVERRMRKTMWMFTHDVDLVSTTEALVGDRKQRVRVGREIHPNDFGLLVHDMVQKSRVLV